MHKDDKIFIAGHRGLVGSAICRRLYADGYQRLIVQTRAELDLTQRPAVDDFFATQRPDYVFLAAAKVGGILANSSRPAEFIFENLSLQSNVVDAAYRHGVKKLLFLGSSCIYPKLAPQPLREDSLLQGPLEPTNEAYAVAKISGIKLCQAYSAQYGFNAISLMPANLYGPGDNFSLHASHVLPALMRKFHEAKLAGDADVVVWGSGTPRREFLHADDLADAALFLMQRYDDPEIINVGTGSDLTIKQLAESLRQVVGFDGGLRFDREKPDGTPRKLLDVSKLNALGWHPSVTLESGLSAVYQWFCEHYQDLAEPVCDET